MKALFPLIYLAIPWGACLLFWKLGWLGLARFLAVCGTLVLDQFAAYQWLAYDRFWAMGVPLVLGVAVVTALGKAKGEEADGAALKALALVGVPILLMLMTYPGFGKMFLLMRADSAVREKVAFSGQVHALPDAEKDRIARELAAVLASEDPFVRWGAVHQLWMCGPAALPAAEAIAKAVASSPQVPLASAYLRRDGTNLLGSLGEPGLPAVLILLREGDKDVQRDAVESLSKLGPAAKAAALPELARYSRTSPPEHSYQLKSAREALGITEQEWGLALAGP